MKLGKCSRNLNELSLTSISGLEPDEQDIMSREHSRLKIDIKRTLTLYQKHVKEKKTPLQQTLSAG